MPINLPRLHFLALLAASAIAATARGHDTWVETNTSAARCGEATHVALMLGNHGNDHRDFKLAGKPDLESSTLEIIAPDASRYDLKDRLADNGYAPSEGFWSARFVGSAPGLYMVAHTSDKVVSYAPLRSIKSAKTFFVLSPSLDHVARTNLGFDRVLGHPLELVPKANTVTPMGPGQPIEMRVLFQGRPLENARVSFIPRGTKLHDDFDDRYERVTDAMGEVSFTPQEGNYYLVVVHHVDPTAAGEGYKGTKYSATVTVLVPQTCPCCDAIAE